MKKSIKLRKPPPLAAPPELVRQEFIDIPTAAATVFVSDATIRRMLTLQKLRRYKFGARTLIRVSELMQQVKHV